VAGRGIGFLPPGSARVPPASGGAECVYPPPGCLLLVAARTAELLPLRCGQLVDLLADPAITLPDLSYSLLNRSVHFAYRAALVVQDRQHARESLSAVAKRSVRPDGGDEPAAATQRVGIVCSSSAGMSAADLTIMMNDPRFRLRYRQGRQTLDALAIPFAKPIGEVFLAQIALAAVICPAAGSKTEFIGIEGGAAIAGYLQGELSFAAAVKRWLDSSANTAPDVPRRQDG